jgi:hypothetical protein
MPLPHLTREEVDGSDSDTESDSSNYSPNLASAPSAVSPQRASEREARKNRRVKRTTSIYDCRSEQQSSRSAGSLPLVVSRTRELKPAPLPSPPRSRPTRPHVAFASSPSSLPPKPSHSLVTLTTKSTHVVSRSQSGPLAAPPATFALARPGRAPSAPAQQPAQRPAVAPLARSATTPADLIAVLSGQAPLPRARSASLSARSTLTPSRPRPPRPGPAGGAASSRSPPPVQPTATRPVSVSTTTTATQAVARAPPRNAVAHASPPREPVKKGPPAGAGVRLQNVVREAHIAAGSRAGLGPAPAAARPLPKSLRSPPVSVPPPGPAVRRDVRSVPSAKVPRLNLPLRDTPSMATQAPLGRLDRVEEDNFVGEQAIAFFREARSVSVGYVLVEWQNC